MTEQGQIVALRPYVIAQFRTAPTGVVAVASGTVGAAGAGGGGASTADAVSIDDTGSYFAGTDVEAALQEIGADLAGVSGTTNLAWDAATSKVTSDTGTDATLTAVDGSNPGLMTVAQKSKLDGIETGATGDQTAAEILAALLTVDGSGSGLDADTLDGTSSAGFATASHNHTGVYDLAGTAASAVAAHEADTTNVHGITDTSALETTTGAQAKADAKVSDTAYNATSWDAVTTVAPSKNAVRDKIEALDAAKENAGTAAGLISDTAYGSGWNSDTTHAPSKNAVYDKIETLSAPAASSVTLADAGNYFTTDNVEAALQQLGPAISIATLQKLTAGMTVPVNSLDRWKAGRGMDSAFLAGPMDGSQTTCAFVDSSIIHDTAVKQRIIIDSEEMLVTATSAGRSVSDGVTSSNTTVTSATASFQTTDVGRVIIGAGIPKNTYISARASTTSITISQAATATASSVTLTLGAYHTVERGINGTTAASHATLAEAKTTRTRHVLHIGDSIAEGVTTSVISAGDGWSVRAARMLANRTGGLVGQLWPMWRNTSTQQVHQEYALTGASTAGGAEYSLGWHGSVIFSAGTSNGFVWTRPAGLRVQAFDIAWVDYGTVYCNWSYSIDGGSTWVTNPANTTIWSSGRGKLRRVRIACDDPTTIRVRAADSGGTTKTTILPYVPLTTYSTYPTMGVTEGVVWGNLGAAGVKLRAALDSRTYTDAVVTNGSATVTSATAAFVAADAGCTVYLEGVAYTISTRDSATQITLTGNYAGTSGSGKRITVFQGEAGDWLATFLGHHGSVFPDLVILGPYTNDIGLPTVTAGDGNVDAYSDMLTYLVGKLKTVANVLMIAPYEGSTAVNSGVLQASYRTTIETVAAAQGVACLNFYTALDAYGVTGYSAANSAGYMADAAHLSDAGNRWVGAHLARCLELI